MDKDGKKSQKTAAYTYDLLGRIKKETKTGREDISYTYDSNNNRKQMKIGNKITAYKYNKNDELLRTDTLNTDTEKDKVVIYKNDKNGNQLATVNRYEIPNDRKGRPYIDIDVTLGDNRLNENVVNHYNALNQLTQTLTKNFKVSFTYDAEGLRTSKTVNGEKTVFVWDGDQVVMELSAGGKVKKRYIRGNDLIYADKGAENASGETSDKQYYVTDTHGNVVQLTDESGRVTKTYEYDSFGNEIKPDSKDDNPFRYCGEYYDKETEEIYLRARYYQPKAGRFLTKDTYTGEEDEPESLHLYTYCENDGVNMIDPTGHFAFVVAIPTAAKVVVDLAVSLYVTKRVYDVVSDVSKMEQRSQLQTEVRSTDITLEDVSAQSQKGKKYQLAYVGKRGKLLRFGKKMSFIQAFASLGVTAATNSVSQRLFLTRRRFQRSNARSQLRKKQKKNNLWGIYADTQIAAKAMAVVTGAYSAPEVHKYGQYGHYHDKRHFIHIWFGNEQKVVYDNLYNKMLKENNLY